MQTDTIQPANQDEQAVQAVRQGDTERYRELVERHERHVYAVAWSRLGDTTLAEEVTQEAFIRGFRRLWLLGDGTKFAAWIAAIARNAAINLGLRHRRELQKRERWALDQTIDAPSSSNGEELPCSAETLRQALEELPAPHRECLVLFYLEGKSGAEAAALMGITEAALRVRLHRARTALRERLEKRLSESLSRLRPNQTLVPAIMAVVASSSSAKAAVGGGIGATLVTTLAKLSPVKWIIPLVSAAFVLPSLLAGWLASSMELRNYRDIRGFRARLFRQSSIEQIGWMAILGVGVVIVSSFFSVRVLFLVMSVPALVTGLIFTRRMAINRNRYFVVPGVLGNILIGLGCLLIGTGWLPSGAWDFFLFAFVLLMVWVFGERPMRMDYNLFLRAAEGMIEQTSTAPFPSQASRLNRRELLIFARFLGCRWFVDNYRWCQEGLELRLSPVKSTFWATHTLFLFPFGWGRCSHVILTWQGTLRASIGSLDYRVLQSLWGTKLKPIGRLENDVAMALQTAWHRCQKGDLTSAERALGQLPDREIFVAHPSHNPFTQWYKTLGITLVFFSLALLLIRYMRPSWTNHLEPVRITEDQARTFMNRIEASPIPSRVRFEGPTIALSTCLVLPPTNLFSPEVLRLTQEEVFRLTGVHPQDDDQHKLLSLRGSWLLHKAMVHGWINWSTLGLHPANAILHFQELPITEWSFSLERKAYMYDERQVTVEGMTDSTLNQLRWLRDIDCLQRIHPNKLALQIAAGQVFSCASTTNQPPLEEWKKARGLFLTRSWPVLPETYFAVAALEVLSHLDLIDREACIRGVLRLHRGRGLFLPPRMAETREIKASGEAQDTLCAFEILRILGALDRVDDLEQWQFRVRAARGSDQATQPSWNAIEAWICQQRFERFLRERRENHRALPRSLLDP